MPCALSKQASKQTNAKESLGWGQQSLNIASSIPLTPHCSHQPQGSTNYLLLVDLQKGPSRCIVGGALVSREGSLTDLGTSASSIPKD